MKVIIPIWFVCICFLFPHLVLGQDFINISGKVQNTIGEALPSAIVRVENTSLGTYSDNEGNYILQLPRGRHTLIISLLGYSTLKYELNSRKNEVINFTLKKDNIHLEAVNIYGKGKNQQLKEGVYSVNAIDVKSVVNSVTNLSELVNRTAGVRIRAEGGLGSDFDLSLNGMSGNSIRYFIDDVPLNIKGNEVSLINLPVNAIERIEMYKGVVPAYLGADALGGAINIITRKERKNFLDISCCIGSFHTYMANLNARICLPKTDIILKPTVGINYSKNNYTMKGVELWNEEQAKYLPVNVKRFHDDYFSAFTQLEAGVENKKWADALFISGSYSKVNKELQTGSIQNIVYGMAEKQQEAWNLSVRYNKRDFLLKKLHFNTLLSHTWDHSVTIDTAYRQYNWDKTYTNTSRNEITGRGKQLRNYKRPLTVIRTNTDYTFNDSHSLNLNYLMTRNDNRRYDELDTDFEPSNDVLTKHIIGLAYSQSFLDHRLANSFFVKNYINHVKVEQTDLYWITNSDDVPAKTTKNNIGYGIGSRYKFATPFALKASYEHAIRLPLARELLGNGTTVYANLALQPENSNNYNLGLFGDLFLTPQHHLYYEANAFFRKVKDYIHAVVSETEGTVQYENVSDVNVKGIEGEIHYNFNQQISLIANCSYQDSRNMNRYKNDGKPAVTYKNKIPNRPWLYSNAEVTFTQPNLPIKDSKLHFSYFYQYVHWFFLTWEGYGNLNSKSKIPTQHQHSVALTYSWKKERYNISLECNNLLDSKIYDNFMLQKPGRSFTCKFRLFIH